MENIFFIHQLLNIYFIIIVKIERKIVESIIDRNKFILILIDRMGIEWVENDLGENWSDGNRGYTMFTLVNKIIHNIFIVIYQNYSFYM